MIHFTSRPLQTVSAPEAPCSLTAGEGFLVSAVQWNYYDKEE